ncbi:MAG TPA: DNA ligase D [Bacteriovoracaceae bacterium]|nr:DNA ligase D [Bacteriovoracaceae bacterium]
MDKLRLYRSKRNFNKTKEPKGGITKKRDKLIFVIQEHHASHIHFDLRLEWKGVLLSWAIPKNISMDPSVKRLAVQTEDHPYEYANFEGHIAQGEYGAGEMLIWDKGEWEPEVDDVDQALSTGKLYFHLKGDRIFGRFRMVKTHYKGNNNWLIMRVDHFDQWPGFIPPMLAVRKKQASSELKFLHELKYDGYRIQAHVNAGDVNIWTRQGKDWTSRFSLIENSLKTLKVDSVILDGEVVSYDEYGHTHLKYLLHNLKSHRFDLIHYVVFDILYLNGRDLRALPLMERKLILDDLEMPSYLEKSLYFFEDGPSFFDAAKSLNLEGILSKNIESTYQSTRSEEWIKVKTADEEVFTILGYTKKGSRLKSLYLGKLREGKFIYRGKVSSGLDSETKDELEKLLFGLPSHPPIIKDLGEDVYWIEPKFKCEVAYLESGQGVLRGASFKNMVVTPVASKKKLKRTSLNRVVYEVEGITKSEVLDFYEDVSPLLFEHLKNRKLNLLRCPKGSIQHCFYQKNWHQGDISGLSKGEDYFYLTRPSVILELAQLNTLEFHITGSRYPHFDSPNEIVLDLDPDASVDWNDVVKGALSAKHLLEELGLVSFVKLTGGKGVHIHVPILPLYGWEEVKGFIHTVCYELQSRNPKLFTLEMSLKVRKNKIFLDYLRNSAGSSYVAPYSLRAKKFSSVALPIEWNELIDMGSSRSLSLIDARKKIFSRVRDPWKDYFDLKQRIDVLDKLKEKSQVS